MSASEPIDTPTTIPESRHSNDLHLWGILLLLVGSAIFLQRVASTPPADSAQTGGFAPQLLLMGKYQLGFKSVMESSGVPFTSSVKNTMLANLENASSNSTDRLRMIPLFAELVDSERAVAVLEEISQSAPQRDVAVLRAIYTEQKPISPADRDFLIERHGWFGELAVTWGLPDDPLRHRILGEARSTFFAVFAFGSLALLMGLAGLTLFIIIAARAYLGKPPRCRYAAPMPKQPGHRAWLESFILFLLIFLGLPFLGPLLPFDATPLSLLMLAAPLWLLMRGFHWREIAQQLGLHRGAGFFREVASGLGGYLAGIPIVFCGFMITLALVKLTGEQPVHPVLFEFEGAGSSKLLGIFLLACVLAPLLEEIIFRGVFYHYLRARLNPLFSAALCGLIFAAIHPQGWVAIPVLGSIGAVFALLREWRDSLIAPMTAHALNNFLVLSMAVFMFG